MTPPDITSPGGSAPDDDGRTADLLRQVLAAEAAEVRPDPQALQTIRERASGEPGSSAGASRGGWRAASTRPRPWVFGVVGAAAATTAIIGGVMYVGQTSSGTPEKGPGSASAAGQHTPARSVSATRSTANPSHPPRTRATGSQTSAPPATSSESTAPTSSAATSTSSSGRGHRLWVSIASPANGSTVSNPVTVHGSANVFEANVNWQLLDARGHIVQQGHANAGFMQWKPFTVRLGKLKPATYTMRAFEASARNGNPTHVDEATFTVR